MEPLTFHFPTDVANELRRARAKFPTNKCMALAFGEEAGELQKALLECNYGKGPAVDVYREAVQAAVMAQRVAEDGDADLNYSLYRAQADYADEGPAPFSEYHG